MAVAEVSGVVAEAAAPGCVAWMAGIVSRRFVDIAWPEDGGVVWGSAETRGRPDEAVRAEK
jgi:hypothetical protein